MSRPCQCPECQSLCRNEPGWFLPEEVARAADFLGLDPASFHRQYLAEHPVGEKVILAPRFDARERRCVFFREGLCAIHEVKPYECSKVYGCEAGRRHKRVREIIVRKW